MLIGSHYNRGWLIHGVVSEALARLLFNSFLVDRLKKYLEGNDPQHVEKESLLSYPEVKVFLMQYQTFKADVRNGKYGKTAKFWTKYYLDVSTNNFDMRLSAIKKILPLCFGLNKQNYARYGSIYVNTLERYRVYKIYP